MFFLEKIIDSLLEESQDLGKFTLVLPGKRPIVFIKKIIKNKGYTGFLPDFITIQDLHSQLANSTPIEGVGMWLFAYKEYQQSSIYNGEDFASFLKWFPTLLKDWDDMLKYGQEDCKILEYLYDEEHIKNWAENIGDISPDSPRKKYVNFWKNARIFLPQLKLALANKNWATQGMIHENAKKNLDHFVTNTKKIWVFCGFNALTPLEENLIKKLLQEDKAKAYFHADEYYIKDQKQEAGLFLRKIKKWKEFNQHRPFTWVEKQFAKQKNIDIIECPGNIAQTEYLKEIISKNTTQEDTAIILLDENLLPATINAISVADSVNITMGYPLKNLAFSNVIKNIFQLQKQLQKNKNTYYYKDILEITENLAALDIDKEISTNLKLEIENKNMVYIKPNTIEQILKNTSYIQLIKPIENEKELLTQLITFYKNIKENTKNPILYENIAVFEKITNTLINLINNINFPIQINAIEQLITQLLASEILSFEGEPLKGLQVMGLLETRLINFKNIILISTNEGKIPTNTSQNSFIPYDVRKTFNLYTYQENDAIYAYHFYRIIQGAENIKLMYNGLASGINTGEKSRYITQLEYETKKIHNIKNITIDTSTEYKEHTPITITKTTQIQKKLIDWKKSVSPSSIISYIHNPINFYLEKIINAKENTEISEEISPRDYGNIIHLALEQIYTPLKNKILTTNDLNITNQQINTHINTAIQKIKHEKNLYEKGINYIHKEIARKTIKKIITHDKKTIEKGHSLKIIDIEKKFSNIFLPIEQNNKDGVYIKGIIDRIDEIDGNLRIIDYKTAKTNNLKINITHDKTKKNNIEQYFLNTENKQILQLIIYLHAIPHITTKKYQNIQAGIWSFITPQNGVKTMEYDTDSINNAIIALQNIIKEILNPDIPFKNH